MLSPVRFQTAGHGATPGHLLVCMYYPQGTNMPIMEDACQGILWRGAHRWHAYLTGLACSSRRCQRAWSVRPPCGYVVDTLRARHIPVQQSLDAELGERDVIELRRKGTDGRCSVNDQELTSRLPVMTSLAVGALWRCEYVWCGDLWTERTVRLFGECNYVMIFCVVGLLFPCSGTAPIHPANAPRTGACGGSRALGLHYQTGCTLGSQTRRTVSAISTPFLTWSKAV